MTKIPFFVIASVARRSNFTKQRYRLPRFARNDGAGTFALSVSFRPWFDLRRWAGLALLLLTLAACDQPVVPAPAPLAVGQPFPAFMLDFISKNKDAAPALQGKLLVLNIWATWCPPCRREMPDLEHLSKTLDPQRFAVVGLSIDADTLLAAEFLLQHGISFANFFDQGGQISRPLGLKAYPETFVIAPDRTLLRRMTGLQDWASPEMVRMLEALYQAQPGAGHRTE